MSDDVHDSEFPPPPTQDDPAASTPPEPTSESGGSFVFILIAMLVLAGGVVYVLGASSRADEETEVAEASARATIEAFDPNEFTSELEPDELALADDDVPATTNAPATTAETDADEATADDAVVTPPTTSPEGIEVGDPIDPRNIALAFVNRIPGEEYETVGWIDNEGVRHSTGLECARIDLNESGGICLASDGGLGGSARGFILDAAMVPQNSFGLNRPSRAAVSPDGAVVVWTGFTLGHSYLAEGEFATITQLISVERSLGANLETDFLTTDDGVRIENPDRNYWGVTFVDSDHFYATMGTEGTTSIVEGRISNSTIEVRYENASCPEVSPDGSTIVAKELRGDRFQLVAIDVASGERRDLGETMMVDDQVEFLDDDTILYAKVNETEGTAAQPVFDIWALDLAPGSTPRMVVPFADSPAA